VELNEELIAELKQKHGNTLIAVISPGGDQIVLRKPAKAVWADFVDNINRDKGSRYACNERLVLSCVCYPATPEAAAVFSEMAGAPDEELAVKKL
jgi:hypothetical protein